MTQQYDHAYGYGSGAQTHDPHKQLHENVHAETGQNSERVESDAPDYDAVKVQVVNAGTTSGVQTAVYQTYVIPASTATVASVTQILPRDNQRQYAYVQAIDAPIVISTSMQDAQQISNVGAALPSGGYSSGGWVPAIRHNEPVWACNTSTTVSCRVVVMVERGDE